MDIGRKVTCAANECMNSTSHGEREDETGDKGLVRREQVCEQHSPSIPLPGRESPGRPALGCTVRYNKAAILFGAPVDGVLRISIRALCWFAEGHDKKNGHTHRTHIHTHTRASPFLLFCRVSIKPFGAL